MTSENIFVNLLRVEDDADVRAHDTKLAGLRAAAETMLGELRAAEGEEAEAAEAMAAALLGDDATARKAADRQGTAMLTRQRARAKLGALAVAIDGATAERPAIVRAAVERVQPAWLAAASAADADAIEAERAAVAARAKAKALLDRALNLPGTVPREPLVSVTFTAPLTTEAGGFQPGDVAGFAPAIAAALVREGKARWSEAWRAAVSEALARPVSPPIEAPTAHHVVPSVAGV